MQEALLRRPWAWLSALTGAVTTAIYLAVIVAEGNNGWWQVLPWALLMLLGTAMALSAALLPSPPARVFAAVTAAVVFGIVGLVSIFSIGLGLLLAAGFALGAALQARTRPEPVPGNRR